MVENKTGMTSLQAEVIQGLVETHVSEALGHLIQSNAVSITEIDEGKSPVFHVAALIDAAQMRWVAKQTTIQEIGTLRALKRAGIKNVPEVLVCHQAGEFWYMLMPEYPGRHDDFSDPVEPSILHCLASIHVCFRDIPSDFEGVDRIPLESFFEESLGNLDIYPTETIRSTLALVRAAAGNFARVANEFPQTLVHWDVHPGNIIVQGKDSVLIDWGSSRSGPAMIDLANVVRWGSPDFLTYIKAFESLCDEKINFDSLQSEYEWARAITQIKYLPYAAKLGNEDGVANMAQRALDYSRLIA